MLGNVSKEDIINILENSENLLIGPDYPHFGVDKDKVDTWLRELDQPGVIEKSNNMLKFLSESLVLYLYCVVNSLNYEDEKKKYNSLIGRNVYFELAQEIEKNIRYIPFEELYSKFKSIIDELISKGINSFICYVPGEIKKSNTWIFLVFMQILKTEYRDYFDGLNIGFIDNNLIDLDKDIFKKYLSTFSPDNKYTILHFDDMSYSGNQIYDDINFYMVDNFMSRLPDLRSNIDYYITTGFISTRARRKIESHEDIKVLFFDSTDVIETFTEILERENPMLYNLFFKIGMFFNSAKLKQVRHMRNNTYKTNKEDINGLFKVSSHRGYKFLIDAEEKKYNMEFNNFNISGISDLESIHIDLVYFQHKVPDVVSILTKIILLSPNQLGEDCVVDSLINNCENKGETYKCNEPFFDDEEIHELYPGDTCSIILAYYKRDDVIYKYSYNKKMFYLKELDKNIFTSIKDIHQDDYQRKYIKYKKKYLELKQTLGK